MKRMSTMWIIRSLFVLSFFILLPPCLHAQEQEDQKAVQETDSQESTEVPSVVSSPAEEDPEDLTYEKSVVMLEVVQQDWDYKTPWKQSAMARGVGTGFIIDGKRILTNAHNVSNIKYLEVKKQNLAKRFPAKAVFVGHDCDLAIIDVDDASFYEDMIPLELGGIPRVNSTVTTCGFPVGGRQVSITKGVVSRIEVGNYSHTQADMHLLVQTDAAINPGNSGGPVLQNGKVVGVAFQGLQAADNIGYMIPTTVIRHFLKDIEDGKYDGFPSPAVAVFEGLHNPAYKYYLKLPAFVEGVVVLLVQKNSTAEKILKPGDVITQIDGFNIDNDGMIKIYGLSLNWAEALEAKQIGESVEITYYRDGKPNQATMQAALNVPILPWSLQFDKKPQYVVYAGLTFTPLSRNYLQTFGRNWLAEIPFTLRYLFHNSMELNEDPNRQEYVVLSEILPDEVNTYCNPFLSQVVDKINGQRIYSLKDVREQLSKTPENGCHQIQFLNNDMPLIIDAAKAMERHTAILKQYQVTSDAYIEE